MKALLHRCNPGLTQRITAFILIVAAIPVVLIALFSFQTGSQGIRRHTEAHLTSVVIVKAQEVQRWLRPFQAEAQVLSASSQVRTHIETIINSNSTQDATVARLALTNLLNGLVENRFGLEDIAILSAENAEVILATSMDTTSEISHILESLSADSPITLYMSPITYNEASSNVVIFTPVKQESQIIAYIALIASSFPLYETVAPDPGLGQHSNVYLVNRSGEVLTPPQLRPRTDFTVLQSAMVRDFPDTPINGTQYTDFLGTEVVAAYQPMEDLNWGVVAELPTSVAYSDIEQIRIAIAGASGLFFLLVFIAAIIVSRRITRPVRALAEGAQAVGKGNLDYQINIGNTDELGILASSFNQMANDLKTTQNRVVEAEKSAALQSFAEQKVDQLKQLSQLGLQLAAESSLEGLVSKTPGLARQTTGAESAAIVIFDEVSKYINYKGHTEKDGNSTIEQILNNNEALGLLKKDEVIIHQPDELEPCNPQLCAPIFHKFKALLSVPLREETGKVIGAILLINKTQDGGFPEEDQELIQIIAGYTSATLQKIRKESSLQNSELKALDALVELQHAQEQLVQAQKMESIGRLAGGVAHDFNNLLTPIMGYAQLCVRAVGEGDERLRTNLLEIQDAAERASNLTRQLLAFSRKQVLEPKIINANDLILNMDKMLRRLIGEDVELTTIPNQSLSSIKADPGQIEQIILNLVVNARDAMPAGGKIIIQTEDVILDADYLKTYPHVEPGQYVRIAVSDNGMGMPEKVKARIFEPFFTTKGEGKGTGLGLATCYGIVEQIGGHISVYSELEQGTTFKIYLPAVEGKAAEEQAKNREVEAIPAGTETILLVEDEVMVRQLASRVLREQGYIVLEASNGEEGMKLFQEHQNEHIDLLLTDVIMPMMGGRELADKIRESEPNIKVLYVSGYTDDAIIRQGQLPAGTAFAEKPFSATALAMKVRQVLDEDSQDTKHEPSVKDESSPL